MEPTIVFGLCLGCFVVGLALGYALLKSGDSSASEKAQKAEAELAEYKSAVDEHFSKTADHFKALGQNYRDLYEHMAQGSKTLIGGSAVPFLPMEQLLAARDDEHDGAVDDSVVAEQTQEASAEPPMHTTDSNADGSSTPDNDTEGNAATTAGTDDSERESTDAASKDFDPQALVPGTGTPNSEGAETTGEETTVRLTSDDAFAEESVDNIANGDDDAAEIVDLDEKTRRSA